MREDKTVTLSTESGYVKGFYEDGYLKFLGVPYARADRFESPVRKRWNGVQDCTAFGKMAMQDNIPKWPGQVLIPEENFDEDCLNLNIYIPESVKGHASLPVLLEIHGGGFQDGSNRERNPGQVIGDQKMIYVSINYRLGIFGYLSTKTYLGEDYEESANCGLLDQMAAVRWVHENISDFGGDPDQITVLGSSAGAKSIGALMMLSGFDHCVAQVIMASGGTQSIRSVETAEVIADGYMALLRKEYPGKTDRELLLNLPAWELIRVQRMFCDNPGNTCMFGPVADGVTIPENWERLAKKGTKWSGRAMIGCSRNEMFLMKAMQPDFLKNAPKMSEALFGENHAIAQRLFDDWKAKNAEKNGEEPGEDAQAEYWARILTDCMYRTYSYRLAERLFEKECKVWQYSQEMSPAYHCMDQMFAFGTIIPMFMGSADQVKKAENLGKLIRKSFRNFVVYGNPGAEEGMESPEEEILAEWKPLSVRSWKAMYWNENSEIKTIPEDDVLDCFPESVYIRNR